MADSVVKKDQYRDVQKKPDLLIRLAARNIGTMEALMLLHAAQRRKALFVIVNVIQYDARVHLKFKFLAQICAIKMRCQCINKFFFNAR